MFLIFLSLPLGCFFAWFGWKAWKVGRMDVVKSMAVLAGLCFLTALIAGGWIFVAVEH